MQRKYIYIIVFILTIALVFTDHYIGLLDRSDSEAVEQLANDLEDNYNAATVSYSLVIKNFQNDDENTLYTYRVKISDINGAQLYTYNNKDDYMVFAANGEANFQVASNQTLIIKEIPEGATYEIEQITDVSNKYTTKVNNIETKIVSGTISSENEVEFANETIIPPATTPTEDETGKVEEEKKENPFTNDNHYLAVFVFLYASIVLFIAFKNKIKRFG